MSSTGLTTLRLALDWTPNTIHTGLFLAQQQGLYEQVGLRLILSPPPPDYSVTPAKRLASDEVDLAIVPSESIIAYHPSQRSNDKPKSQTQLKAIYAILQRDASAIVTTNPRFRHLKNLEHGTYASYNARYEDAIVRTMVTHAGGNGSELRIDSTSPKLSLFDRVKSGKDGVDATWVFLPWEGVEAETDGVEYSAFTPGDFGVPYGYSPVICYDDARTTLAADVLMRFVNATREGYRLALQGGGEAGLVLEQECEPRRSRAFLGSSQQAINRFYGETEVIGRMDGARWRAWVDWLASNGLLVSKIDDVDELFTNEFFDVME